MTMDETVINGLAIIGAITCVIWLFKGLKALLNKFSSQPEAPAGVGAAGRAGAADKAGAAPGDDMVVIAAAVYAMLGRQHVVHFDNGGGDSTWAAEGRWMHQTSHAPH
jgi:hypothetical protein